MDNGESGPINQPRDHTPSRLHDDAYDRARRHDHIPDPPHRETPAVVYSVSPPGHIVPPLKIKMG